MNDRTAFARYEAWQALKSAAAAAHYTKEGQRKAADYHSRNAWEAAMNAVEASAGAAKAVCLEVVAKGLNPVTGWA